MKCRHCRSELVQEFVDLGWAPPSNAYRRPSESSEPETHFPLRVKVCNNCWLVQTEDFADRTALFAEDYAYFSSVSKGWLAHAERYVSDMVHRFSLSPKSLVVEIAANDGYLLQFVQNRGIPCFGVEPTRSTAAAAREKGIDIVECFFGLDAGGALAKERGKASLIAANNVLAHVPDINDFVSGFAALLADDGVATFEFPHLYRLVEHSQFDTIYHEHFSYLSLEAVAKIFQANGLQPFDVEELPTHGGSLRVYAQRVDSGARPVSRGLTDVMSMESAAGMASTEYYRNFQPRANLIKDEFVRFLIDAKRSGKKVVGYGAAAKGNTLLNFGGVRPDLLPFVVDRNVEKQGKLMPGSHIPICDETRLVEERPDFIVILPWNLRQELEEQLRYARQWGAKFVVAVPALTIF